MQFNHGMIGVIIVMLSLAGGVFVGVITNVETQTVSKDVSDYVADITGAFEYERDQSYADYNPSKNYNGYVNNTVNNTYAVDFRSAGVNNYPITYTSGNINSVAYTSVESFAETVHRNSLINYPGYATERYKYVVDISGTNTNYGTNFAAPSNYVGSTVPDPENPTFVLNSISLDTLLQDCITDGTSLMGETPVTIQITIPYTVCSQEVQFYIGTVGADDIVSLPAKTSTTVYYLSNNTLIRPNTLSDAQIGTNMNVYTKEYLMSVGVGNSYTMEVYYDVATNNVKIECGGVQLYSGSPVGYTVLSGVPVAAREYGIATSNYSWPTRYRADEVALDDLVTNNLTVTYKGTIHRDYIDTRYGIGIRDSESVTWSNDQSNGVVSLALSVWDGSNTDFPFTSNSNPYRSVATINYKGGTYTDQITVERNGNYTYISLNGETPVNIGTWTQIQIDIDGISGKIIAYPIQTWDNFNNYGLMGTQIEVGSIHTGDIVSLTWAAENSFRLQVVNTRVFYNTYGVIMKDPHINISNLWPNYDHFQVKFRNMASIGSSITIGNTTYPIENNMITIHSYNPDTYVDIDITDMVLTYEKDGDDWDITIESGKKSVKVNEPNTNISLTGSWYFNTDFYNVISKMVTENVWNPIWNVNFGFISLFMAGFILIGGAIMFKLGYLDWISIGILIATEVILIIVGGTT